MPRSFYNAAGWHVDGTALDTSYAALEAIAQQCMPADLAGTADARRNLLHAALQGATHIRLVHPWMLANEAFDGLRLGVIHLPFHRAFPWSGLRWRFVMDRMTEVTDALYIGDLADLNTMLPADATVESTATLHPAYREALASLCGTLPEPARRFPNPARPCRSFSAFWSRCTGPEGAPRGSWHR